jgi:glutaredoxin-related protein
MRTIEKVYIINIYNGAVRRGAITMRPILAETNLEKGAKATIESFHTGIVRDVEAAIKSHEWVIIGMKQNPVVRSARRVMDEKKIKFHYIEYGSYVSMWKERLAIKMWSGWPTFPQVFHKGRLVGGASDLKAYLGG